MRRYITPTAYVLTILYMSLPILSLPPFRLGHYGQIEQIYCAFWGLSGIAALWFGSLWRISPKIGKRLISYPVVWGWGALTLATLICSLPFPNIATWFGSPQVSTGGLLFLSSTFASLIFLYIKRFKAFHNSILASATFIALGTTILTSLGSFGSLYAIEPGWNYAPLFFTDYTAFFATGLLAMYAVFSKNTKYPWIYWTIGLLSISIILHLANNNSMTYGMWLGLLAFGILWGSQKLKILKNLPFNSTLAFGGLAGLISLTAFISFYDQIAHDKEALATILSRMYLAKMTFMNFLVEPFSFDYLMRLLFGFGWSSYINATLYNLFTVNNLSVFINGDTAGQWEFLSRDLAHSHNILLETFLATGLVGLTVLIYALFKMFKSLKDEFKLAGTVFLTALLMGWGTWFECIHTVPFTLFGLCLLFSSKPTPLSFQVPAGVLSIGSGTLLLTITTIHLIYHASYLQILNVNSFDAFLGSAKKYQNSWISTYDALIGGHRQVLNIRKQSLGFEQEAEQNKNADLKAIYKELIDYAEFARRPVLSNTHLNGIILSMNIYGEMVSFEPLRSMILNSSDIENWHNIVDQFMDTFPYRNDILIPYLNWLSQTQQKERLYTVIHRIEKQTPNDPIAQWYEGLELMQYRDSLNTGICKLDHALRSKIERYMPIPADKIQQIQRAAQKIGCTR